MRSRDTAGTKGQFTWLNRARPVVLPISREIQSRGSEINQQDLNNLERRWITLELARQMGLRRVSGDEAAQILNRKRVDDKYAGLLIPNIWPSETAARGNRIRRDRPDVEVKSDGTPKEKNKYLSGYGDRNLLYFVPGNSDAIGPACLGTYSRRQGGPSGQ
jgi:hypothetical protein